MPAYSFKINIELNDGTQLSFYNPTFANSSGSTYIEAPQIVTWINNMPRAGEYLESEEGSTTEGGSKYGSGTMGSAYLSASFTGPASPGDSESGSVVFTDTETTTRGGLKKYTFWGTKVCSVLGLPEGIPIYPENFKLSDDEDDPDNYMSGDVIANGVSVKESFKLTSQARVKGNLVWDQVFGEGYVQWVSGSTSDLRIGYNPDDNLYEMVAGTVQMNVVGIDELGATNITASGHINVTDYVTALGGIHVGGTSDPGANNLVVDGNITVDGTVDSRDIASDGVKLDTIEQNADVTDATNVAAAGALMDSELSDITAVKGINQDLTTTSDVTFDDVSVTGNIDGDGSTNITDINQLEVAEIYGYNGDTDTKIDFGGDGITITAGNVNFIEIDEGTSDYIVFNQGGGDVNFRVENDVHQYGLYNDGARTNTFIGYGAALPSLILDSAGSGDNWTSQGAQIVIGESAGSSGVSTAPGGGAAALYLTYHGGGYGYIGMGGVTSGVPDESYIRFDYNAAGVYIKGTLSKDAGTFTIKHPDPEKSGSHALQHSFVESPTAGDNIYTFVVSASADNQTVVTDLPSYWKFLNENPRMWIQPKGMFAQAYGEVSSSLKQFSVTMEKAGSYDVLLIGTRKDESAVNAWSGSGGLEPTNEHLFPVMPISDKIKNVNMKYTSSYNQYTSSRMKQPEWLEISSSLANQLYQLNVSQSLNLTGSNSNPPWKDEL